MKFYLKLDAGNTILDAITYPHEGYTEVTLTDTQLPAGINGGWFKWENGAIVEYLELQPKDLLNEQIRILEDRIKTASEKYKELDLATATLDEVKDAKMAQLDEACNISIINGFNYTINSVSYHFSCSISAQANFQGTDTLFKDGVITEAEWTVANNSTGKIERIILDQTTFNTLKFEVFKHIDVNVKRLRNTLEPLVESATTNQEIDSIVW